MELMTLTTTDNDVESGLKPEQHMLMVEYRNRYRCEITEG